jgi:HK97 family phage prohead protease
MIDMPIEVGEDEASLDAARFNKRQETQYEATESIVETYGPYDQTSGPDGAHYVAQSPFAATGLVCSNCAFYEGPRGCEVVAGDIDPNGICKLWVIPGDLIMSETETPRARILEAEEREINGRQREVRVIGTGIVVEERAADAPDGEPIRFHGYAAVFNSPSERLWDRANGEFTETIAPGAFKRTLGRDNDVRMYINHNSDQVLASTRSGTMNLAEDGHGLRVDAELPDTTYARDLANLMRSGVVDSMSFGFTVIDDTWQGDQRELREVALHEVSVVTGHPAYPETAGASVRSTDTDEQPAEPTRPLALAQRYHQLYSHKR